MMKFASEKTMALADGQLAAADAPELVQELARNPALVEELQAYLAMSRSRIARPYRVLSQEAVPDRLIETVMRTPVRAASRAAAGPLAFVRARLAGLRERYSVPGWSLAAGPALAGALVAVSAWFLMPTSSLGALVSTNLDSALEKTASGGDAPLVTLRPTLSFKSNAATWCRQYEVRYGSKHASYAVACRADTGGWQVVMETVPSPIARMPASTFARRAVDDFVTANMAELLTPEQDKDRTANGWRGR
jgi:hypothetical protein